MQIQKQSINCVKGIKIRTVILNTESAGVVHAPPEPLLETSPKRLLGTSGSVRVLESFEQLKPMCFSERFPRLTCLLITCGIFAAALVTEIECLRGAGYYWW